MVPFDAIICGFIVRMPGRYPASGWRLVEARDQGAGAGMPRGRARLALSLSWSSWIYAFGTSRRSDKSRAE